MPFRRRLKINEREQSARRVDQLLTEARRLLEDADEQVHLHGIEMLIRATKEWEEHVKRFITKSK